MREGRRKGDIVRDDLTRWRQAGLSVVSAKVRVHDPQSVDVTIKSSICLDRCFRADRFFFLYNPTGPTRFEDVRIKRDVYEEFMEYSPTGEYFCYLVHPSR